MVNKQPSTWPENTHHKSYFFVSLKATRLYRKPHHLVQNHTVITSGYIGIGLGLAIMRQVGLLTGMPGGTNHDA